MDLRNIRISKGLTQEYVSKLSNISRGYYTQIELGVRHPSVTVAKAVASTLEFDWQKFFENSKLH